MLLWKWRSSFMWHSSSINQDILTGCSVYKTMVWTGVTGPIYYSLNGAMVMWLARTPEFLLIHALSHFEHSLTTLFFHTDSLCDTLVPGQWTPDIQNDLVKIWHATCFATIYMGSSNNLQLLNSILVEVWRQIAAILYMVTFLCMT